MITYELATRLKKRGFKQEGNGGIIHAKDCDWDRVPCAQPYVPTLSELIEACGHKFFDLRKQEDGWYAYESQYRMPPIVGSGSNPEEAVANLWLTLNKK